MGLMKGRFGGWSGAADFTKGELGGFLHWDREYGVDSIHTLHILINGVDKLKNMVHHFSFKRCIKHLT